MLCMHRNQIRLCCNTFLCTELGSASHKLRRWSLSSRKLSQIEQVFRIVTLYVPTTHSRGPGATRVVRCWLGSRDQSDRGSPRTESPSAAKVKDTLIPVAAHKATLRRGGSGLETTELSLGAIMFNRWAQEAVCHVHVRNSGWVCQFASRKTTAC